MNKKIISAILALCAAGAISTFAACSSGSSAEDGIKAKAIQNQTLNDEQTEGEQPEAPEMPPENHGDIGRHGMMKRPPLMPEFRFAPPPLNAPDFAEGQNSESGERTTEKASDEVTGETAPDDAGKKQGMPKKRGGKTKPKMPKTGKTTNGV